MVLGLGRGHRLGARLVHGKQRWLLLVEFGNKCGVAVFVNREFLVVEPIDPGNESSVLERLADPIDPDRHERDQCHEGTEHDHHFGCTHSVSQ